MNSKVCSRVVAAMMVVSAFMLAACDRRTVYDKFQSTPIAGWEKNDTLTYAVKPLEESSAYAVQVGLRTTDSYPFTSLTLIMEQEVLPSHRVEIDTIHCDLTDKQGNNLGYGVGYRQYLFAVGTFRLEKGDSLHIVLRHDMKREILPGISDVGISLVKERQ